MSNRLRLHLVLCLVATAATEGGVALATEKSPDAGLAWTISWRSHAIVDHGDGVHRGTEEGAFTVMSDGRREGRPQLGAVELAELSRLLNRLPPSGTYQLQRFVNDEGLYEEWLEIEAGGVSRRYDFQQGRDVVPAPETVARIYFLVTGRPLPARVERR